MFKAVQALKIGSAALSTGIVHFNPERAERKRDPRYAGGIFSAADAAVLEKKKLGKVVGEVTQEDYDAWNLSQVSGIAAAAVARINATPVDSPVVDNIFAVAHPAGSVGAELGTTDFDPDAAPGANGGAPAGDDDDVPEVLKLGVRAMPAALAEIDDLAELNDLGEYEAAHKKRATALEHIDARIAEVRAKASAE